MRNYQFAGWAFEAFFRVVKGFIVDKVILDILDILEHFLEFPAIMNNLFTKS